MVRQQLLVRTLVELGDTLVVDYDVVGMLYLLTERCAELFNAAGAAALVRDPTRALDVVAGSEHDLRTLQAEEAEWQEGPGWRAYATGRPVTVADLTGAAQRWPRFAAQAARLGLRGVHAEPVRLRDERIGVLDIFRADGDGFSDEDRFAAAGLASMAAVGIITERARAAADAHITQLRSALESRAVVEQAKVLLAERLGTDPETAFDWLRRYARNHNRRLRDVAQQVLGGHLAATVVADESTTNGPISPSGDPGRSR